MRGRERQEERHPVGLLTMEQALARWGDRIGEGTDGEQAPLLEYAAIAFGYTYRSPAVLDAPDATVWVVPPDELHAQPNRDLVDVLQTSMASAN